MIEPLMLTTTRVHTFDAHRFLTNASGFFFERDHRLFLVTSRHVLTDAPSRHFPARIEIEFHVDAANMARSRVLSIPLYRGGTSVWRQGLDAAGEIDVGVIEIERSAVPETAVYHAFTPEHLRVAFESVEIGTAMLVVGFPLGFHDSLHHLPVARHAVNASSFGLRFEGRGYFLTDARTHRGTSGAPIVTRALSGELASNPLPWSLLGIHSARLDLGTRDYEVDEALGLNCAWYADILLTLTER